MSPPIVTNKFIFGRCIFSRKFSEKNYHFRSTYPSPRDCCTDLVFKPPCSLYWHCSMAKRFFVVMRKSATNSSFSRLHYFDHEDFWMYSILQASLDTKIMVRFLRPPAWWKIGHFWYCPIFHVSRRKSAVFAVESLRATVLVSLDCCMVRHFWKSKTQLALFCGFFLAMKRAIVRLDDSKKRGQYFKLPQNSTHPSERKDYEWKAQTDVSLGCPVSVRTP